MNIIADDDILLDPLGYIMAWIFVNNVAAKPCKAKNRSAVRNYPVWSWLIKYPYKL